MSVAGARPNFIKLSAIADAIEHYNISMADSPRANFKPIEHTIIHTGQHYDEKMSKSFFEDLGIPRPDINLEVGSGSHAAQTAEIMKRFEPVLLQKRPDILLLVGDVNSTIACALVAVKITYPDGYHLKRPLIAHVEAGLRSFDMDMPEEINRILTDSLSDFLFVTERSGIYNLRREGIDDEKIHFVGNVMIDTLLRHLEIAKKSDIHKRLMIRDRYSLLTLHRPSNVDNFKNLKQLIDCFVKIAERVQIVFPVHPRTQKKLKSFNLFELLYNHPNILLTEPLGYLDFINLIKHATIVITDSGGIQEETTYLQVPCVTLRENTERPVTITEGSNYLVGLSPGKILSTVFKILSGKGKKAGIPELWDGKAGERIINIILREIHSLSQ